MRCVILVLAVIILIPLAQAQENDGREIKAVVEWVGRLRNVNQGKSAPSRGFVTNKADFDKLWKDWRPGEKPPVIDFESYFVVTGVSDLMIYNMHFVLTKSGDLKVSKRIEKMERDDYALAILPRAGIKSVNGKALEPKDDAEQIRGKWKVISTEEEGKNREGAVGSVMDFKSDGKVVISKKGKGDVTWGYRIDVGKNHITLTYDKDGEIETTLGIYDLNKEKLTLCVGEPKAERPKEFKALAKGVFLITLEREKR